MSALTSKLYHLYLESINLCNKIAENHIYLIFEGKPVNKIESRIISYLVNRQVQQMSALVVSVMRLVHSLPRGRSTTLSEYRPACMGDVILGQPSYPTLR